MNYIMSWILFKLYNKTAFYLTLNFAADLCDLFLHADIDEWIDNFDGFQSLSYLINRSS